MNHTQQYKAEQAELVINNYRNGNWSVEELIAELQEVLEDAERLKQRIVDAPAPTNHTINNDL